MRWCNKKPTFEFLSHKVIRWIARELLNSFFSCDTEGVLWIRPYNPFPSFHWLISFLQTENIGNCIFNCLYDIWNKPNWVKFYLSSWIYNFYSVQPHFWLSFHWKVSCPSNRLIMKFAVFKFLILLLYRKLKIGQGFIFFCRIFKKSFIDQVLWEFLILCMQNYNLT